jgi:arylsulfatase A-like enzyme
MAHNDYQLGRFIARLKDTGEWQNTILIVSSDHSIDGSFTDTATQRLDPVPPGWTWSALRASVTRVPLIITWPGRITGGRRVAEAVSLIDLLPTVLDLAGLTQPLLTQGQSLAPLLRGEPGWAARPVILEEIGTGAGNTIEVVDGRWGASLQLAGAARRPSPLLLFDLWNDPLSIAPVNAQHQDLVEKYTKVLEDTWRDHQALAKQFKPGAKTALTPEQLERLRSLGYIR